VLYAVPRPARDARSGHSRVNLQPLFESIVATIHRPLAMRTAPCRFWSQSRLLDYFGRIAICRVFQGTLHAGDDVTISKRDGSLMKTRITKLFTFSGLKRIETTETTMGDIVAWRALKASPSAKPSPASRTLRRCR